MTSSDGNVIAVAIKTIKCELSLIISVCATHVTYHTHMYIYLCHKRLWLYCIRIGAEKSYLGKLVWMSLNKSNQFKITAYLWYSACITLINYFMCYTYLHSISISRHCLSICLEWHGIIFMHIHTLVILNISGDIGIGDCYKSNPAMQYNSRNRVKRENEKFIDLFL